MDSIISMGQKYLSGQSGGGGGNGGGGGGGGFDFSSLASLAQQHDTQGSGDSDLFGNAASFLQNNDQNPDDVDEDELQQNEQRVNQGGQAHSSEIGNAAAVSSVKNMLSGGGLAGMLGGASGGSSGGGGMQQKIVSMAMAQAAAMFDQKQANGEVTGGDKQSAVNSAGSAATKLMLKYGAGGNMGVLASKFM